jgi:alkylation response protein AidB-like acyl-CoA dehydrogenase
MVKKSSDTGKKMQLEFTEDQRQFREMVARFLEAKSGSTTVRQLMISESGYDPAVWQQLCGELGLAGTHIPEEYGGFGFGPVELGIATEEMGRHLYCGPFFASAVMAGYALMNAADEASKNRLLPDIASGELIAALVLDDLGDPFKAGSGISAVEGVLNGSAAIVVDAVNAACLVVLAGKELYQVNPRSSGVTIEPLEALDPTRKIARVAFNDAQGEKIGDMSQDTLLTTWEQICVALSHEMIGGMQRLFDTTIEYTKLRYQFGRPIGSFQGLKHRAADLLMEVEFAKAATHYAAFCLATGEGDDYAPSMAKALASDTYMKTAKEAIQFRGGIGFTWEEDTQLWYKRAKSSEMFMGSPQFHRERMMCLVEAAV